jgi:hypothetical protein
VRNIPVGSVYIIPVVAWQSVYRYRVQREWVSGGAVSSTASAFVAFCCVIFAGGAGVGTSGEQYNVVLAFMRTWSKWSWCMALIPLGSCVRLWM